MSACSPFTEDPLQPVDSHLNILYIAGCSFSIHNHPWMPIKCYAAALTSTPRNRIDHPLDAGLFGSGLNPGCQVSARHLLVNL